MVIPSLIQHKRDGNAIAPGGLGAPGRRLHRRPGARLPDVGAADGGASSAGSTPDELAALTDAMLASGDRLRFDGFAVPRVDKHSTGGVGRQGLAAARADGRELRRGGADDVGPRTGPHRRHARQAGGDSRLPHRALARGSAGPGRADRLRHAGPDPGDRAGGPEALRAARRHRHGGVHPADLRQHHVEEAGRGAQRPGARREDRERRLHPRSRPGAGAGAHDDRLGEARGCPTVALLTAMDRPLGRACGHSLEVEEALEGLQGRGPDGPDGGHLRARRARCSLLVGAATRRGAMRAAGWRRRSRRAGRSRRSAAIIEAQGGNRAVIDDPAILPQAGAVEVFRAPRSGVVADGGAAADRARDPRAGRRPA